MVKEVVKFVSTKPYLKLPYEVWGKMFLCLHGRKEIFVLCSDELLKTIENLPSDYVQPRLIDIKKYLNSVGIPYIEDFSNTTTV
jgi:hypothetical protein